MALQATTYFKFYLLRALQLTGMGGTYLSQLNFWHRSIAEGKSLKGSITLPPGLFRLEMQTTFVHCHAKNDTANSPTARQMGI